MDSHLFDDVIEIHPEMRGGIPVLKGTRFPVARVLAELGEDETISEIAEDYDIDANKLRDLIENLAMFFDQYFLK
ncbi:MAG: DUF433 domain-containing protein [Cyanobacteria bacterium P01_G01_bin.54]